MTTPLSSIPAIALSSIPGTNVFAGFIKFFVYLTKADEYKTDLINRMTLDNTGKKVAEVGQDVLDRIDNDYSNLKWFSLLQMIPIIGIIGVIFEQRILHATVTVNQPQISSSDKPPEEKPSKKSESTDSPQPKGQPDLKNKSVVSLTNANYKNYIGPGSKGTVFVLYHQSTSAPSRHFKKMIDDLAEQGSLPIAEVEVFNDPTSRVTDEVVAHAGIKSVPVLKAFNNGLELGTFTEARTVDKIHIFIETMLLKAKTSNIEVGIENE